MQAEGMAEKRRELMHYRGVARALALAAASAQRAGGRPSRGTRSASPAGRGAAAQGNAANARPTRAIQRRSSPHREPKRFGAGPDPTCAGLKEQRRQAVEKPITFVGLTSERRP